MPASAARRASSGPASASASTLTMTMCLRCAQASSAWRMPAAGLPVASMTMSSSGCAISASASSCTKVVPCAQRFSERARGVPLRAPADACERLLGARRREIGDAEQMQAGRARHLREEHRTEFAGADQADAHGFAGLGQGLELGVQIHGWLKFARQFSQAIWDSAAVRWAPRKGSRKWPAVGNDRQPRGEASRRILSV